MLEFGASYIRDLTILEECPQIHKDNTLKTENEIFSTHLDTMREASKKIAAIMEEMDQTLHKNKTPAKKEHPYAKPTQNKPPNVEKQTPTTNNPNKDQQGVN